MKLWISPAVACFAALSAPVSAQSVLTYHNSPARSGVFAVPGLTQAAARGMHFDTRFRAGLSGQIYAQPLYWQAPGAKKGVLIVATESNFVYALNPDTGAKVWTTQLAPPAPRSALQCGDIDPEGVTGTPVIDDATGTLYLDATVLTKAKTARHMIYALSLADGKVLPRWPLNVEARMNARRAGFSSFDQGERSALQFVGGRLYAAYAGRAGDCGGYHGQVIEFTPSSHAITGNWATRAIGGGIWSQGGVTSDGTSLFATTGNTFGADSWGDGEAVIRLLPGLARSTSTADYFTPTNWKDLDNLDLDLGSMAAFPITVPTASGVARRVIAMGKGGYIYVLNAKNLGGIGHAIEQTSVSAHGISTGSAFYNAKNYTLVTFTNAGGALTPACAQKNLTMLKVTNASTPVSGAWCAPVSGGGTPIITTTVGSGNPIAWVVGAEGDNKLHGFDAVTGKSLFESGVTMAGLHHFSTLIAANGHLYVAGDGTIYAFTF